MKQNLNKYEQRLYQEWKQHGKIVIACDWDDTLHPWKFRSPEDLADLDRVVQLLRVAHETGAYIVIFTACNQDRYPEIQARCEEMKLPIEAINQTVIDVPYGKTGKIYANIFLDDRGGLTESIKLLETVMYIIRGEHASSLTEGEGA